MYKIRKVLLFFLLSIISVAAFAQSTNAQTEEPIGFMRSEGKIYVVMAVVVTIVAGIFIYLVNLDRKISKLENK